MKINDVIDDRYKILKVLGEGGMAIVYLANDIINNKEVAVNMFK